MKKILFLVIISIPCLQASTFNLAQELNVASEITETFNLIAAYQKITLQIQDHHSTRLTKKLIKLIKNLHPLCQDSSEQKIKFAYKILLETAIANDKLKAIDYQEELPSILNLYAQENYRETEDEEILPETLINTETTTFDSIDPIITTEEMAEIQTAQSILELKENLKDLSRDDVISLLYSKRIMNHIDQLEKKVDQLQGDVTKISKEELSVCKIYKKLSRIEILLSQLNFTNEPIRASIFEDLADDDFTSYSPLLQQIIIEDKEFQNE